MVFNFVYNVVDRVRNKVDQVVERFRYGKFIERNETGTIKESRVRMPTTDLDFNSNSQLPVKSFFQSTDDPTIQIPYSLEMNSHDSSDVLDNVRNAVETYLLFRGPLNYDAPLRVYNSNCPILLLGVKNKIESLDSLIAFETYCPTFWVCGPDDGSKRDVRCLILSDKYERASGNSLVDEALLGLTVFPVYETCREAITNAKFTVTVREKKVEGRTYVTYIVERFINEEWNQPVHRDCISQKVGNNEVILNNVPIGSEPRSLQRKDRIVVTGCLKSKKK